MNDNLVSLNNDIMSNILNNIEIGLIVILNSNLIYINKYILDEFGNSFNYLKYISENELRNETVRYNKFVIENIESEKYVKFIVNSVEKIMNVKMFIIENSNGVAHVITLKYTKTEVSSSYKDVFLANISHEVRTPLNGIIGMLTLLEDTTLNSEQKDYIDMTRECSFNLMTIVNDILDFSKLEAGKLTLDIKCIYLRRCIEKTSDIILGKLVDKNIEFSFNIDEYISDYIEIDENRITQVLLNLLSNSIKFTTKGFITLDIKLLDDEYIKKYHSNYTYDRHNKNTLIKFTVKDTGCGIKKEDFSLLFKSFSQVNQLTTKLKQGTGLGLAISKYLISLMGGIIWLEWSKEYEGSCFSFIIPTKSCFKCKLKDDDLNYNEVILKDMNVLILDDNLHNRLSLAGMISKWGMKAYNYGTSEEALFFSKFIKFDIGLIDICMPKLDGYGFATKLYEIEQNKSIPLIALSSLYDKIDKNDFNSIFKSYLVKPIKELTLKRIILDTISSKNFKPDENVNNDKHSYNSYNINCSKNNCNQCTIEKQQNKTPDNLNILIVEDVYINQQVVINFLKKIGYSKSIIDTVENGEECLNKLTENTYDIILLDIKLPILDGEQVLKFIQDYYKFNITFNDITQKNYILKNKNKPPYIVAITAFCLKDDKQKYINMGFDDYISKPVNINNLKLCMTKFVNL